MPSQKIFNWTVEIFGMSGMFSVTLSAVFFGGEDTIITLTSDLWGTYEKQPDKKPRRKDDAEYAVQTVSDVGLFTAKQQQYLGKQ